MRVENADVDFGLVRYSSSSVRTITITNLSEVPAVWSLKEALPYNLIDIDKVSFGRIFYPVVAFRRVTGIHFN